MRTIVFIFLVIFLLGCNKDKEIVESIPIPLLSGIMVVPESELIVIKGFGGQAISAMGYHSGVELQILLDVVKVQNMGLVGRAQSRSAFSVGNKLDFAALEHIVSEIFTGNSIAGDSAFLGYYILDEPCHSSKWNISLAEMCQFYTVVKGVNSDIQIMTNFGYLGCAEKFVTGESFADIAAFTITAKKLRQDPGYIANQAAVATTLKQSYPDMKIVALVAVYEYPAQNEPIPSADWVRDTGLEVISYSVFDGIMFYPWSPSSYMGETIEDIADDPAYINAFKDVFGGQL